LLRIIRVYPADVFDVKRMLTAPLVAIHIASGPNAQVVHIAETALMHGRCPIAARRLLCPPSWTPDKTAVRLPTEVLCI